MYVIAKAVKLQFFSNKLQEHNQCGGKNKGVI